MVALADLVDRQAREVTGTVANAKGVTEAEIAKLRVANETARSVLGQAQAVLAGAELQRAALLDKYVASITPDLVAAIGKAVVIREQRYNVKVQ